VLAARYYYVIDGSVCKKWRRVMLVKLETILDPEVIFDCV